MAQCMLIAARHQSVERGGFDVDVLCQQLQQTLRSGHGLPWLAGRGHTAQVYQGVPQRARAGQHLVLQAIVREVEQQVALGDARQALREVDVAFLKPQVAVAPDVAELSADQDQQTAAEEVLQPEAGRQAPRLFGEVPAGDQRDTGQQPGRDAVTQRDQGGREPDPREKLTRLQGVLRQQEPGQRNSQRRDQQRLDPLRPGADQLRREPTGAPGPLQPAR